MNAQARDPQSVVEAFVEEYKNQHNWDCVDTYVAEACKLHLPLPGLPSGREGMRVNGRMVCTAFPDVYVTREFSVVEGNIVVERAHAKATHKGKLMGIAATGNPVAWSELHAYRVEDGLIAEIWTEADFLGIMVQIGAVEMPTPRLWQHRRAISLAATATRGFEAILTRRPVFWPTTCTFAAVSINSITLLHLLKRCAISAHWSPTSKSYRGFTGTLKQPCSTTA